MHLFGEMLDAVADGVFLGIAALIADEFDVAYALEGIVRNVGQRIRHDHQDQILTVGKGTAADRFNALLDDELLRVDADEGLLADLLLYHSAGRSAIHILPMKRIIFQSLRPDD